MKIQQGFILGRLEEEANHIVMTSHVRSDLSGLEAQIKSDADELNATEKVKFLEAVKKDVDLIKIVLQDIEREDNRLVLSDMKIVEDLMEIILESSSHLPKSQTKDILARNANTLLSICRNSEKAKFY